MANLSINLSKLVTADDKFVERRAAKIEAVKAHGESILQLGFPFDAGVELGVQHLQTRNSTDKTNWLTSQNAYNAQIAAGNGEYPGASFRTAENNTITLTFNDAAMLLLQMAGWGAQLFQISWAKQDAIRLTTNDAELDAIDITTGWEIA